MDWLNLDNQYVISAILSLACIVGFLIVLLVVNRMFRALEPRSPMPPIVFKVLFRVVRILLFFVAVYLILTSWRLETGTVFAVIGTVLGMVAIGFVAVWSLLSNLMCAFMLVAFRPFRIGDMLEIPSEEVGGRAVDITLLFTTLEADDGALIRVPNNQFFQKIFKCRRGAKTIELGEQLMMDRPADESILGNRPPAAPTQEAQRAD